MYKYTNGIIIEKITLPKGNKILVFCKNLGLNYLFYPYKIKNLDLDILNFIAIHLKHTKEYTYINQYQVINYFENIRKSYHKKIISQTILEIIKKTLPENQKENDLFKITLSFLNFLDQSTNKIQDIKNFQKFLEMFILKIGYPLKSKPQLNETINLIERIINNEIKTKELLKEFV